MSSSARRRNANELKDIVRMTVALTVPFVGAAVGVVILWIVAQGLIDGIFAVILGLVGWIGLSFALSPTYSTLLNGAINRPGCLMGLIFYAIGLFAVTPLIVWQLWPDWINAGLIAVLVVPILSLVAAFIGSRVSQTGNKKGRRR